MYMAAAISIYKMYQHEHSYSKLQEAMGGQCPLHPAFGAGGDMAGLVQDGNHSVSRLQRGSCWRHGGGGVA